MWIESQEAFGGYLYNMGLCEKIDVKESYPGDDRYFLEMTFPALGTERVGSYKTWEDAAEEAENIIRHWDDPQIYRLDHDVRKGGNNAESND